MDIGEVDANKLRGLLVVPVSLLIVWFIASQAPSQYEKLQDRLPSLNVNWDASQSPYNESKLAVMIEDRPLGHLAPLLLHMMSVVPAEWPFLFVGSTESLNRTNTSEHIQFHKASGKLRLVEAPDVGVVQSRAKVDRILTNLTFYERYVDPAEWLLVFHPDSILCARSEMTVNDWLGYDWVGAPWLLSDPLPGSGGLSLRRVSRIKQVLNFQYRQDDGDPEDRWFTGRIGTLAGARTPTAEKEAQFCVQDVWHENPMGYHISSGGTSPHPAVWEVPEQRKKIFAWCPEVKMILDMKFKSERCAEEDPNRLLEVEQLKLDEQKKAEDEAARQAEERRKMEELKAAIKAELKQEADEAEGLEGEKDAASDKAATSEEIAGGSSTDSAMGPAFDWQVSEGPLTHRV